MQQISLGVDGLINGECKTRLKNALDKVKGVQKVGISLNEGKVVIDYNDPADARQIKDCIETGGFKVL